MWGLWESISLAGYDHVEAVGDRSYNQTPTPGYIKDVCQLLQQSI